jgi:DNA-directed RNA polymerase subunit RPC12/RpoP
MNCPNCTAEMTSMTLEARQGRSVAIDLCAHCQAFWFDKYENLQIAPVSTLQLMKFIGERPPAGAITFAGELHCPRCSELLPLTHDWVHNTQFTYWRCKSGHGHFIRFFEFLREKNFIRPLAPHQIAELRKSMQVLNCSNCGAPMDLSAGSACPHCGSPISIVDLRQSQELLDQLRIAGQPRALDPTLPLDLAKAKREMDFLFSGEPASDWLKEASGDLVHACLTRVAGWLNP